ncbi:conserved hypothetical protein [Rhodospirillum centenum SW]|uniref:Uncharacterized protein n=1 Tax=Rhodospirillum centenum (strain ATCC 51521 / SW) TaxID=414684 RepID=B6IS61_RHOCS|nr:conserved hypothetical protein [Rhodospirillum centenum SW]
MRRRRTAPGRILPDRCAAIAQRAARLVRRARDTPHGGGGQARPENLDGAMRWRRLRKRNGAGAPQPLGDGFIWTKPAEDSSVFRIPRRVGPRRAACRGAQAARATRLPMRTKRVQSDT